MSSISVVRASVFIAFGFFCLATVMCSPAAVADELFVKPEPEQGKLPVPPPRLPVTFPIRSQADFNFRAPNSMTSPTRTAVVLIPESTGTLQYSLQISIGMDGSSPDAFTDTLLDQTRAVTQAELLELDVSEIVPDTLNPGVDYVGLAFVADQGAQIVGLLFEYDGQVPALQTEVNDLGDSVDLLQAKVNSLQLQLDNFQLAEDSVGNSELQEDIVLGDENNSGSFSVKHSSGSSGFQVFPGSGASAIGQVVIGKSGLGAGTPRAVDMDLIVRDPLTDQQGSSGRSLFFDSSRARLELGSGSPTVPGQPGQILMNDGGGEVTLEIDGATGDLEQTDTANGLVKAWAIIKGDGTIVDCYNCRESGTGRIIEGHYQVDFAPVSVNISGDRPALASLVIDANFSQAVSIIVQPSFDSNKYQVNTYNNQVDLADANFMIVLF